MSTEPIVKDPSSSESESESESETEKEYCNAGEHYVNAEDMWHDLGDCMGCTTAKERDEILKQEED